MRGTRERSIPSGCRRLVAVGSRRTGLPSPQTPRGVVGISFVAPALPAATRRSRRPSNGTIPCPPLAWRRRCPAHEAELAAGARSVAAIRAVAGTARRAGTERRDATRAGAREQQPRGGAEIEVETAVTA